jgi:hypothetical protein
MVLTGILFFFDLNWLAPTQIIEVQGEWQTRFGGPSENRTVRE